MPTPACCYCGTELSTLRRRRHATSGELAGAAQYRQCTGAPARKAAVHICESCHRRPPALPPAVGVRHRVHHTRAATIVLARSADSVRIACCWCTLCLLGALCRASVSRLV